VKYVIKYATKAESSEKVEGRIWGMTDKLRDLQNVTTDLHQEIWDEIKISESKGNVKTFNKDYFSVYFLKNNILDDKDFSFTSNILRTHYVSVFNNMYNKSTIDITCQKDNYELESLLDETFNIDAFFADNSTNINNSDLFGFDRTQFNSYAGKSPSLFH
jgi:hypothetical protein